MIWSRTIPEKDGWYVWREEQGFLCEIVHVWTAERSGWAPNYNWTAGTRLCKRVHEELPEPLDVIRGEFLKCPMEGPVRIDLPHEEDKIQSEEHSPPPQVDEPIRKTGGAKGGGKTRVSIESSEPL